MRHTYGNQELTLLKFIIILLASLIIGIFSAHFFKGNKQADLVESCVEKIIESETGISIDFDQLDEELCDPSPFPSPSKTSMP